MVHKRVLLRLGKENVNVFVDGVCFLMVEHFLEIIFQLRLKRGNVDEAMVAQIKIVPIMQVIIGCTFLVIWGAVLLVEFRNINVLVGFLHFGE